MSIQNTDPDPELNLFKKKKRWVNTFSLITFGWYFLSFIYLFITTDMSSNFSSTLKMPTISVIVSNTLAAVVCFYLTFRLNRLYKEKKSIINKIMTGYFVVVVVPTITNAMLSFIDYSSASLQTFIELSFFYLLPGSWLFLAFFIIETFNGGIEERKNLPLFYITIVVVILTFGIVLYLNLWDPTTPVEGLPGLISLVVIVMALGLSMFIYFLLALKSYKLQKQMKEKRYKHGLILLSLSGIFLSTIAVGRILALAVFTPELYPVESLVLNITLDVLYLLGYIFFYLGVTIPRTKK